MSGFVASLMLLMFVITAMVTGDILMINTLLIIYGTYFMWKLLLWWIDVSVKEDDE